jgi:hypothetical protein
MAKYVQPTFIVDSSASFFGNVGFDSSVFLQGSTFISSPATSGSGTPYALVVDSIGAKIQIKSFLLGTMAAKQSASYDASIFNIETSLGTLNGLINTNITDISNIETSLGILSNWDISQDASIVALRAAGTRSWNGLTTTDNSVGLGGTLSIPTTITTSVTNSLKIAGLVTSTANTPSVIVIEGADGSLRVRTLGTMAWETSTNYYGKGEVDILLYPFATNASVGLVKTTLDASIQLLIDADKTFATNASVGLAFGPYATNASVNAAFVTTNASFGAYATNASVGLVKTTLDASIQLLIDADKTFATNASVGLAIAPFATNASVGLVVTTINASLGLMATNASVGLAIAPFATNASVGLVKLDVDASIQLLINADKTFATNASVGIALGAYATNVSVNAAFATNSSVGLALGPYATNASVNAALFTTNASFAAYATNASIGLAAFAKNASLSLYLEKEGGTMTGPLSITAGGLSVTNNASINGGLSVVGDTYIGGTLTIDGSLYVRSVETIDVSAAYIRLNTGMTGVPPAYMQSGIVIERGSDAPYVFLYDETLQTFRIGIVTDASSFADASTQAVATREDSPVSFGVPFFNNTLFRFDTSVGFTFTPGVGLGLSIATNQGTEKTVLSLVAGTVGSVELGTMAFEASINYYSKGEVDILLYPYATNASVGLAIAPFATNASIGLALGPYATNASVNLQINQLDASIIRIDASLNDTLDIAVVLAPYATNASVGLAIAPFATNASVGLAIAPFATNASVGIALSGKLNSVANIGVAGNASVFSYELSNIAYLKKLVQGTGIAITEDVSTITITSSGALGYANKYRSTFDGTAASPFVITAATHGLGTGPITATVYENNAQVYTGVDVNGSNDVTLSWALGSLTDASCKFILMG